MKSRRRDGPTRHRCPSYFFNPSSCVPACLNEIATGLGIGAAQALQQVLRPAVGVGDREGLLDPLPDVFDGPEPAGLDLVSELTLLQFGQFPWVSFVPEGAEGVEAAGVVQLQPVPDGARS